METLDIKSVLSAKNLIGWMDMGIVPSQKNAQIAADTLKACSDHFGSDVNLKESIKFIRTAASIGCLPSEENCKIAKAEIGNLIDRMREVDSQQIRSNFRQSC